jgi:hypothetical protein
MFEANDFNGFYKGGISTATIILFLPRKFGSHSLKIEILPKWNHATMQPVMCILSLGSRLGAMVIASDIGTEDRRFEYPSVGRIFYNAYIVIVFIRCTRNDIVCAFNCYYFQTLCCNFCFTFSPNCA